MAVLGGGAVSYERGSPVYSRGQTVNLTPSPVISTSWSPHTCWCVQQTCGVSNTRVVCPTHVWCVQHTCGVSNTPVMCPEQVRVCYTAGWLQRSFRWQIHRKVVRVFAGTNPYPYGSPTAGSYGWLSCWLFTVGVNVVLCEYDVGSNQE